MNAVSFPDALTRFRADRASDRLHRGIWRGTVDGNEVVCMMGSVVAGANSTKDCVTAGWPEWLVDLNVSLFDAEVGADDETTAAFNFAERLFTATSRPFDPDRARGLFLIARLEAGEHSALKSLRLNPVDADWWRNCEASVLNVAALIRRKLDGEDVSAELNATRAAAYAAAFAAAFAAARAARAADAAAYAATYAARAAAYAAADAADAAARAATYAARVAARADLVEAITESRITEVAQ